MLITSWKDCKKLNMDFRQYLEGKFLEWQQQQGGRRTVSEKATTMSQLKGISQNVMHSSVVITDQVYGRLVGEDVKHVIEGLG